jgi:hypothetical protein
MGWSEDAGRNRDAWTKSNAEYTDGRALASWNAEPAWGIWNAPEAELGILGDVTGLDVVELGCGTAYVSAWLARAGARPVGVDITPAQLETARRCMTLRPGGRLVFLCNSTLVILCSGDEDEKAVESLQRPQKGMHRFDQWDGVEFHIPHGERIDLLRANGFELQRLVELYAPEGAADHAYYDFVSADWARRWPVEEIWVSCKR